MVNAFYLHILGKAVLKPSTLFLVSFFTCYLHPLIHLRVKG